MIIVGLVFIYFFVCLFIFFPLFCWANKIVDKKEKLKGYDVLFNLIFALMPFGNLIVFVLAICFIVIINLDEDCF